MLNYKSHPQKKFWILSLCILFVMCNLYIVIIPSYALNIDRMRLYFLNEDYAACITEGEKILAASGYSKEMDQLYYLLALSYLKEGNYLRASDIFEIILQEFKDSKYREESLLGLGDAYFLKPDYGKASQQYEALIGQYPKTKFAASAYYRISQCAFKAGDTAKGNEYACKLKDAFPLNLEGRSSMDIACDLTYYSVQVGSFSRETNASNLVRKLSQQGFAASIEKTPEHGKVLYRVRVGKVRTQPEASSLAERLARLGYPTKICP